MLALTYNWASKMLALTYNWASNVVIKNAQILNIIIFNLRETEVVVCIILVYESKWHNTFQQGVDISGKTCWTFNKVLISLERRVELSTRCWYLRKDVLNFQQGVDISGKTRWTFNKVLISPERRVELSTRCWYLRKDALKR
jgi:hypothetical protein